MSVMSIDIFENGNLLYVAWVDEDDGGPGAWIGQEMKASEESLLRDKKARLADGEWEMFSYYALELEARKIIDSFEDSVTANEFGYLFDRTSDAKKMKAKMVAALKLAKVEFDNREVEMPEWAKMALAAGWKKPKGWKP